MMNVGNANPMAGTVNPCVSIDELHVPTVNQSEVCVKSPQK
ncbi:hypothetical protein NTB88_12680 [Aeromonas salmonicida]|nr:hypothetical protein [Aeromonas salmonicida]MCR4453875.1 hypothetical protein [Aeromonas salmonicida]